MSADTENMLMKLQLALSQQANQGPSLYGLQAQQDPNQTAALLKHLQDQAYVQQQGNPGGDWADQFGQAGKKDFARMGQGISSLLGIGQPQQYDNSATMAQRAAIQGGKGQLADALSQPGADPLQTRIDVLSKLAQNGVPGAADLLAKAQDDMIKMQTSKATAGKDDAQAAEARARTASIPQDEARKDNQFSQTTAKDTWTTIGQGNGYIVQKNGLGEIATKKNTDAASAATASVTADGMKSMLDYYHTNGTLPPGVTRSPAMASMFWQAEGQYQNTTGNTAAASAANKMEMHSLTADTTKTQTQMGATSAYLATMDKNIEKARTIGNQLDFSDATVFNKALQAWDRGTSDPQYAKYNVFFNSVATEYAKLSSGNMGNTSVSDSQRHETQQVISSGIGNGGMNGIFDALKEEGANKVQGFQEHLAQNMSRISQMGGNARQGLPQTPPQAAAPPPQAPPAAAVPTYNPKTGKFE